MKRMTALFLAVLIIFSIFSACAKRSDNEIKGETKPQISTTPSGYMLTPEIPCEIEGYLKYKVVNYNGNYSKLIDKAETLVRKWWDDDSTFSRPIVVWMKVLTSDIRGFQADGYLFLDPYTENEMDMLATIVHEWLHHLVGKFTLISSDGLKARPIMEMVVEAITVDILESAGMSVDIPTDNYRYFINNNQLYSKKAELVKAFRNQEGIEAYERIFGKDYMKIIERVEFDFE